MIFTVVNIYFREWFLSNSRKTSEYNDCKTLMLIVAYTFHTHIIVSEWCYVTNVPRHYFTSIQWSSIDQLWSAKISHLSSMMFNDHRNIYLFFCLYKPATISSLPNPSKIIKWARKFRIQKNNNHIMREWSLIIALNVIHFCKWHKFSQSSYFKRVFYILANESFNFDFWTRII